MAYRRLLQRFCGANGDFVKNFNAVLQGNLEAVAAGAEESLQAVACRQAHTLKGVAGNIGAVRLSALAGALETFCSERTDGFDHATVQEGLASLQQELGLILEGLEVWLESGVPGSIDQPLAAADEADLADLLLQLRTEISNDDTEALDTLPRLSAHLHGQAVRLLIDQIEECLNNFDFDEAGAVLEELESGLES